MVCLQLPPWFLSSYRHGSCLHEPHFEFFKDIRPSPGWGINPVGNGKTFKVQFVITAMVRVFTNHILSFQRYETWPGWGINPVSNGKTDKYNLSLSANLYLPPWFVSSRTTF
jgi:hypothetical protein